MKGLPTRKFIFAICCFAFLGCKDATVTAPVPIDALQTTEITYKNGWINFFGSDAVIRLDDVTGVGVTFTLGAPQFQVVLNTGKCFYWTMRTEEAVTNAVIAFQAILPVKILE